MGHTLDQSILSHLRAKRNRCAHTLGELEISSPGVGFIKIYHAFVQLSIERRRDEWLYCSIRSDNGEMI